MEKRITTRACEKQLKKLNRKEKLLFLYLLSPLISNNCGICSFSIEKAGKDIKLSKKDILAGLKSLEGEVFQFGGILIIKNFNKYCYAI